MANVTLQFDPNPTQERFIVSRAKADLFAARMGEGKSTALCWAVWHHTHQNPGAQWALIRGTWEDIQGTTMKEFFKWFTPGIFGDFNQSKKTFTWAIPQMGAGAEVRFLGLDDPQDASKLQSRELAGFGIDEPAPAAATGGVDEFIFDIAMSRLRQPGMNWYAAKLAENNPDESHWTYRRFVRDPGDGFKVWQSEQPENEEHLPDNYYSGLRSLWSHRPDLISRFVEGKFGFQSIGKAVTPQWSDNLHLAYSLGPVRGVDLHLLWDFGLNPTCIITQITPMGFWNILEAHVGQDIGVQELIENVISPTLRANYPKHIIHHIGDPQGSEREQSSSAITAVMTLRKLLGGDWRGGPRTLPPRLEPLRAVLSRTHNGVGLVRVDKRKAEAVWLALRGGWHHNVARTGVTSPIPVKDMHSHPGDAMSYGASILYPMGALRKRGRSNVTEASFFESSSDTLLRGRHDVLLPSSARRLG